MDDKTGKPQIFRLKAFYLNVDGTGQMLNFFADFNDILEIKKFKT